MRAWVNNDTSSTGNNKVPTVPSEDETKNSAFLGEADSDDGFEAHVEAYPEAHRHIIEDASVSGMHGESGEGDGPFERGN